MIPVEDMRYYIDPVQDKATPKVTRLYVNNVMTPRTTGAQVGQTVDVKSFEQYDNQWWWVTEDGYYVDGAPVNSGTCDYQTVVAPTADGFTVGQLYTMSGPEDNRWYYIRRARHSTGKVIPGTTEVNGIWAKEWMRAAPWAMELMPAPGDDAVIVARKLEVAKLKHRERNAMAVILQEGKGRGWNEKLEPLREDHRIPRPVFGAMVTGDVLMELSAASGTVPLDDLTEAEQERVRAIAKGNRPYMRRVVQVPVKFPARLNITDEVKLSEVSSSRVLGQARDYFNDYSIEAMGSIALSPILRNLLSA